MADTFDCPKCGAPLTYEGEALTVPCQFCGSSVVVPESLRPKPAADPNPDPVEVQVYSPTPKATSTGLGYWWLLVGLIGLVGGIPLLLTMPNMRAQLGLITPIVPTITPTPSPTPFAQLATIFGREGIGPGHFSDARSLTVDSQGRVFVGDYHPGRIQAFAADGTFLWQQTVADETDFIRGLAVGLQGRLYALVARDIYVYQAESGEQLAHWQPAPDQIGWYYALTVTPTGEVLAVHPRELVKFDPQGNLLLQVGGINEDFLKVVGVNESSMDVTGVAVDGNDTIYISTTGNFLLKLDAAGNLIDRLPGEIAHDTIAAVAVDGQGRLAWLYSGHVVITDNQGNPIGDFKTGSLNDIEFNLKGQLIGINRSPAQVEVYNFTANSISQR